jgi:hypothetical protein
MMINQRQTLRLIMKHLKKAVLKMMKILNLQLQKCLSLCTEFIDLSPKVKVLKIFLIVKILTKNFKNSFKMNLINAKLIMILIPLRLYHQMWKIISKRI